MVTLSKTAYEELPDAAANFRLDFDDLYQFKVAQEYGLIIVTIDRDFENVQHEIQIIFL